MNKLIRKYSTIPYNFSSASTAFNNANKLHLILSFTDPSKTDFTNLNKLLFDSHLTLKHNKFFYILPNTNFMHYSGNRMENIMITDILKTNDYTEQVFKDFDKLI
jgi:hypothetical protein